MRTSVSLISEREQSLQRRSESVSYVEQDLQRHTRFAVRRLYVAHMRSADSDSVCELHLSHPLHLSRVGYVEFELPV